jgi:hypothetical protein
LSILERIEVIMNPWMKKGLLGLLLLSTSSCIQPLACPAIYKFPSLELTPSGGTVVAPGSLTFKSDGRVVNGCDQLQATSMAFYADGVRVAQDNEAPFEVTWSLEIGKQGVPVSGSKDLEVYGVTNLPGLNETQRIPLKITVPTP